MLSFRSQRRGATGVLDRGLGDSPSEQEDDGTYDGSSGVCGCELPIVCAKLERPPPFVLAWAVASPGAPPIGPPKPHWDPLPNAAPQLAAAPNVY